MPARILGGIAVHLLTASGAVCGLIALHHAAAHDWAHSLLWLGAAAIIDAIDGPIARRVEVKTSLPRFSGARLDLVVDYFSYCVVPAFIVMESGIAGAGFGILAGAVILLSSLFHFCDLHSKTDDGFFVGFPAIWNAVCLYLFVFATGPLATLLAIFALAAATFVPVKWIHPLRVRRLKTLTAMITLLWSGAALYEVLNAFPGSFAAKAVFSFAAVYLLAIGVFRTFIWRDPGDDPAN